MKLSSSPRLSSGVENRKSRSILPSLIKAQVLAAVLFVSGCNLPSRIGITMCTQGHALKDEIAFQKKAKKFCKDGKGRIYQKKRSTCLKCDSKRGVEPEDLSR